MTFGEGKNRMNESQHFRTLGNMVARFTVHTHAHTPSMSFSVLGRSLKILCISAFFCLNLDRNYVHTNIQTKVRIMRYVIACTHTHTTQGRDMQIQVHGLMQSNTWAVLYTTTTSSTGNTTDMTQPLQSRTEINEGKAHDWLISRVHISAIALRAVEREPWVPVHQACVPGQAAYLVRAIVTPMGSWCGRQSVQ